MTRLEAAASARVPKLRKASPKPNPSRARRLRPLLAAALLVLSSCVSVGAPSTERIETEARGAEIVVGAFNFSESAILGQLYGRALQAEGLPVKILGPVAPREVLAPALEQGVVDIVPEYQGTALSYWTAGQTIVAMRPGATHRELAETLDQHDLVAAGYASVENKNEVVVPRATADKYELLTIGDLETVAPTMVFGGPRECPERPLCLPGLERIYDLAFAAFQPLDAGGPLTTSALEGAEVDAAVMFTTDPNIEREELVILDDDRNLQPSENVVPILRREVVERYGERVVTILDEVTASLTTADLVVMNARVQNDEQPADVALEWLADHGLIDGEDGE